MVPRKRTVQEERVPARQQDLHLWPEKVLWASVLLFLIAGIGVLNGILRLTGVLEYSQGAPAFLAAISPWYVITVSVFTGLFGYMAVSQRSTGFATLASIFGLLSVGFLATNTILSIIALLLIARANMERHGRTGSPHLTEAKAPHKPLAASLTMLAAGVVTLLWGLAIAFDIVAFSGYFGPDWLFGTLTAVVGLLAVGAAYALSTDRGVELAMAAAVFVIASASLYVVGPALALIAIGLEILERHDAKTGRAARLGH